MSAKRIVFPKDVITRAEKYDFSDDGTQFRGYLYKNTIPITYTRYKDEIYASIRMDYCRLEISLGVDYADPLVDEYREVCRKTGSFNGVSSERFDMNKFVENCEAIYQFVIKYRSPQEEIKRIHAILENTENKLKALFKLKDSCLERISELGGETVCQQM